MRGVTCGAVSAHEGSVSEAQMPWVPTARPGGVYVWVTFPSQAEVKPPKLPARGMQGPGFPCQARGMTEKRGTGMTSVDTFRLRKRSRGILYAPNLSLSEFV